MKVGDKVVTRFGTGFIVYLYEQEYVSVMLDGQDEPCGFMVDHVQCVE